MSREQHHPATTWIKKMALQLAALGWYVLVLAKGAKTPVTEHGVKDATTSAEQVELWWDTWPEGNVGVATGARSGIWVLDVDEGADKEGSRSLAVLTERNGPLPKTVEARTGGGGLHLFFAYDATTAEIRNSASKLGPGLDVRGEGGYVVVPPSRHPNGTDYEWVRAPWEMQPAPAPAWLVEQVCRKPALVSQPAHGSLINWQNLPIVGAYAYAKSALDRELAAVGKAPVGNRNNQLNRSGYLIGQLIGANLLDQDAAAKALAEAAAQSGLDSTEIESTLAHALRDGMANPNLGTDQIVLACLAANEVGDAYIYAQLFRGKFLYDHTAGCHFKWAGHHWEEDITNEALPSVSRVVAVYGEAANKAAALAKRYAMVNDKDAAEEAFALADELRKRMHLLNTLTRRQKVLTLAAAGDEGLGITGNEWDREPNLLGVANGVIELQANRKQLTFRPGEPGDLIKTVAPTKLDMLYGTYSLEVLSAFSAGEAWPKFVREIMNESLEKVDYLQRLFGYSLTGQGNQGVFPILWGKGRNGKTVLLETLKEVLGPLAGPIKSEMLLAQARLQAASSANAELMTLWGKRFGWASETEEGRKLDAAKVKLLSGGDTILARAPYGKREVSWRPTHLLFLLTNHRPRVDVDDFALWERLHLVPFELSFVEEPSKPNERQADPLLLNRLKGEASNILMWLLAGWAKYVAMGGLHPPNSIKLATGSYRSDEDQIGAFIDQRCVLDPKLAVRFSAFQAAYKAWAEEQGIMPFGSRKISAYLAGRFEHQRRPGKNGYEIWYVGLALAGPDPGKAAGRSEDLLIDVDHLDLDAV